MTKFRDQQGRIRRLGDAGERFRGSRPSRNATPAPGAFDGRSIDDKLAEIGEIIEELERSPALKDLITAIDPIERSPILQGILDKIELIDLNAITLLEDIVRSTHFHDITRQHGDKISQVKHELTLLEEAGKVTATSLTELYATVAGLDTTQQAHYQGLITAIADEVSARVTALSELHAQMVAGDSAVSAALAQQISEVEVTAEQARASLQTTLAAAIMDGDTAVSQALNQTISEAVATAEAARASLKTFLEAQIADGDSALSTAINHRIDNVEADAEGARASMQDTLQTQFTNADNAVKAALVQQISETEAAAEAARASLKTQLQAQITGGDNAVKAALNHRIDEAVTDADSALAASTAHLQAQIDDGDAATAALSQHVNTVEANAASARASLKDQLQAQMTEGDTAVSTALNLQLNEVATTAEQSLASAVDVLNAQIASSGEVISDALNARVDTVEANAASALAATETTLMVQMADNNAAMQQQVNTKITAAQAETIAQTKVQAFQNGNFALLQQEFNVVAGEHTGMYGQWQANYSVKINAGTVGGKPVVAGIALSANPETGSDFIVMADRFAVVPPSYTNSTQTKMPFVVGQVNGVNTVGIQGQLLVDGSITANKISVNTLSAVTANAGTINSGTFKTHTLDANGNVADPTEFRAEMSNVGQWPLWIGSGTKTANNSVMWIDKQGNAEFKGKIKAGNVVGQFQRSTVVNWQDAVPLETYTSDGKWFRYPDYQTVTTFALEAPMLTGESHIPSLSLRVVLDFMQHGERFYYGNSAPPAPAPKITTTFRVSVLLEELTGGSWKVLYEHKSLPLSAFTENIHAEPESLFLLALGSQTSTIRQFRVRARFISATPDTKYPPSPPHSPCRVIAVSGSVIGIR